MLSYYSYKEEREIHIAAKDLLGAEVSGIQADDDDGIEYMVITLLDGSKLSLGGSGQIGIDSMYIEEVSE